MTLEAQPLSPSIYEKLAAASTPEEVKAVLTASQLILKEMNMPLMGNAEHDTIDDETPNQAYRRFRKEFEYLENVAISRQDATKKYSDEELDYNLSDSTLAAWQYRGWIRVVKKAARRGLPTLLNERDVAVLANMDKLFRNKRGGRFKDFKPIVYENNE